MAPASSRFSQLTLQRCNLFSKFSDRSPCFYDAVGTQTGASCCISNVVRALGKVTYLVVGTGRMATPLLRLRTSAGTTV